MIVNESTKTLLEIHSEQVAFIYVETENGNMNLVIFHYKVHSLQQSKHIHTLNIHTDVSVLEHTSRRTFETVLAMVVPCKDMQ